MECLSNPLSLRFSKPRRPSRRDAGVVIELAITLPLLLFVAIGCADLGRFAHYYIAVGNAAEAGALFGCMHPVTPATRANWNARIRETVTDEMANVLGYDETRLTIPDPQLISETTSNFRRVRVEVTYRFEMIVDWPGVSREHDLTRAVEMRVVR